MTISRSLTNPFEMVDRTPEILVVPNQWGLINQLGIFGEEGVAEHTIQVEKQTFTAGSILDRVRGERANVSKDANREVHAFPVPHFPIDDYVSPQDIQGRRAYGSDNVEQEALVIARKLDRLAKMHFQTMEVARAQAITAGTVYAPNGTVSVDWYSSFGITRTEIDIDLDQSTTDPIAKIESVIAAIQDNLLSGEIPTGIVALCSPVFFNRLIQHAKVVNAYQYYVSTMEPLRNRLAAQGLDSRYREFYYAGVRFIEYRGSYGGTALIPSGDAYFLPTGMTDSFKTFFSPANKFDLVNTIGERLYAFEYRDNRGEKIEIQTETNFINMLRLPQAIVRGYTG
jgi:hypothetical protein